MEVTCCCGQVHELPGMIADFIRDLGADIAVMTEAGSWRVPRAYIAVHGLAGANVSALASVFGWPEANNDAASGAAEAED